MTNEKLGVGVEGENPVVKAKREFEALEGEGFKKELAEVIHQLDRVSTAIDQIKYTREQTISSLTDELLVRIRGKARKGEPRNVSGDTPEELVGKIDSAKNKIDGMTVVEASPLFAFADTLRDFSKKYELDIDVPEEKDVKEGLSVLSSGGWRKRIDQAIAARKWELWDQIRNTREALDLVV